ncbi:UDP-glycosyltransferase 73E1-like [Arachis hypogaea]|uniref:Glycosyltransferase n=1 Tax=Arachis hypogaea TaxID=3818 RepID=A0A445E6Z8_ARAHY|nr:UDP-glycosyltransferase 73E1-like [Arachis hypogaea]XP_025636578.1 UDP-glycosyltransferase 73E1-like [Arachis hypogaea]QHO26053.1 UDP-glycosyltransferase [Arachis hypogaea]RYR71256.1 hypothetical protein Ahy_A02g005537 [Arachis hypogaea]
MALESHNMKHQLHFLLVPYLCPGHLIPMVDIARLLVNHGAFVTFVTTPLNVKRIKPLIDTVNASKLRIRLIQFEIPVLEFGLPEGCESLELVPSRALIRSFMFALSKLQTPIEELIEASPISCILVDKFNYWMENVAMKFQIPRLIFDGTSCMNLLLLHNLFKSKVYENVQESKPIVVPNLPHRIELTKSQLPLELNPEAKDLRDLDEKIRTSQESAYGYVINSFEELELDYVKEYKKVKGNKVWCIGPVSLSYNNNVGQRGNKSKVDLDSCLKFLDSWPTKSVVYVCLGSLNNLALAQFQELALALESCNFPFIWVMKEDDLFDSEFEERTKERGLIIHGWAPQVLLLSHNAIGVFLTHCGWNSTLEAICAGLPMITWPMFADQFFNEKLIVQILCIGEELGNEIAIPLGKQENYGASIKREKIVEAIEKVIGDGAKKEERRESVRKLAELAKKSMEVGGSSYLNMKMLLDDMETLTFGKPSTQ